VGNNMKGVNNDNIWYPGKGYLQDEYMDIRRNVMINHHRYVCGGQGETLVGIICCESRIQRRG
jgi:hypothetical protein